ncbi:UNVERIFIED_CONTAM: hypothetical protein Sradi_5081200 [Sesamum radiatum]|uniref:SWIM-type domain-containing protein n=1 Tax=Sesamum radiatum TaxID=300843 RepID=A0AAW2M2T6_SESRA
MALRSRRLNHLLPLQYGSGDDFESEYENEEGDCKAVFNASKKYDPNFEIGMSFSSKSDFKDAVYGHAVKTRRSLKITKNDSRRIYARCDGEGCEWRINVLKVIGETTFQIREYNSVHTCARSFNVKNVNSGWLSKKYEDSFRTDPNRAVKGFRKDVIKDIRCNVSKYQAYRAKRNALNAIDGATDDQFALLWDYAEELRKSNPRSNVIMVMTDSDDGNVNKKFAKFYVMFDVLRVGFLSGCRPIIGVDGCHLKGPHGGVLLTAVSIDPNNNLYPLAYAIVSGETREAWERFLGLLKSDLNMVREDAYTFISDKQKGLIPAFESVFPGSDKRYCVRHLHGNMKTAGFKGLAYKFALWNVARATTKSEFKVRMEEMIKLNERVVDWLSDKPPVHWSMAFFDTFPKCDILLNNVCESFNSCILEAREKPFLTMLEWIREFIMLRLTENRDRAEKKWSDKKICPKIRKILDKNMDKAADSIPIKSDQYNYEISCYDGARYVVNLQKFSCSCRKWDLTGIPCNHAMSAICSQVLNPEDFVNPCYSVQTFKRVYRYAIMPVNGPKLWAQTGNIPPLPPNFGRKAGRPSRARRIEPDEIPNKQRRSSKRGQKKPIKLKRQSFKVKCHYCGGTGHNQKGCDKKKEDGQNQPQKRLTARKRTISTPILQSQEFISVGSQPPTQGIQSQEVNVMEEQVGSQPPTQEIQSQEVNVMEEQVSHPLRHIFSQYSNVNEASGSGSQVPFLTKGGKRFVTMTNLPAAIHATKKKKPNT